MVMYEIWSLGHKPFEETASEEVLYTQRTILILGLYNYIVQYYCHIYSMMIVQPSVLKHCEVV